MGWIPCHLGAAKGELEKKVLVFQLTERLIEDTAQLWIKEFRWQGKGTLCSSEQYQGI